MNTKPLSGFLIGICAAAGASASTCNPGQFDEAGGSNCVPAPPGSYVPTPGANQAVLAQPGSFVPAAGSTASVLAPAGRYVDGYGATEAKPAELGFYVAVQGASAPTPVSPGFYTATVGSTAGIGAGQMAAPLNMAIDASRGILLHHQAMAQGNKPGLDVAVSAGSSRLDQAGLAAGATQDMRSKTLVLQHTAQGGPQAWTLFGGLSDHALASNAAGSGQAQSWLLGGSRAVTWGLAEPVRASVFAGHSSSDMVRRVSEVTTPEVQNHSAAVRIMGLQLATGMPLPSLAARLVVEGGVTQYTQSGVSESGAAGSTAGLTIRKSSQLTVPVFAGLQHQFERWSIQWGLRADLNPQRQLNASLNSGGSYSFLVPVRQSATSGLVGKVKFKEVPLSQGLTLSGGAELESGSKLRYQQLHVVLAKRW